MQTSSETTDSIYGKYTISVCSHIFIYFNFINVYRIYNWNKINKQYSIQLFYSKLHRSEFLSLKEFYHNVKYIKI